MFKYFEPNKIFAITSKAPKYVLFLFIIVLTIGLTEALILSPEDYKQSDAVRIMYVHVPAAWISLGIFTSLAFLSVGSFVFKNKNFALIAKSLAPSGFIFNIIALVTGSIWGNLTWGTYWVWDARLTSMLILSFIYLGHILLLYSFDHFQKADFAASILAIIGLVNLPIVKFSVDWWTTLHQGSTVFRVGGPSITSDYLITLLVSFFALFLLCIYWFSNIFYIITDNRRIERFKLLNQ